MANILIIEDDVTFARLVESFLKKRGHTIAIAHNLRAGKEAITATAPQLILLDYRLPDGTGQDVLEFNRQHNINTATIIMTAFHDIKAAVRAVKTGAQDYITKPVNPDELLMLIDESLHDHTPAQESFDGSKAIKGSGETADQLQHYIELVAQTNMSVILQGESGTGKEEVAKSIHRSSKRNRQPFVAIDCGALSSELAASELFGHIKGSFTGAAQDKKGQFEVAHGGTLFMDEVGNLSYDVQLKLLRALQEREIQAIGSNKIIKVDVRIITATNDDLLNSVKEGSFREDLYHRLNEFKIQLQPLRQREDIDLFIDHFIGQACTELNKQVSGISEPVRDLFYKYEWPGNLRELKNVIKRAVLLTKGDMIEISALPDEMAMAVNNVAEANTGSDIKAVNAANEKELIMKVLKEVRYNKSKAAKILNIDRSTLYSKIAKYDIE